MKFTLDDLFQALEDTRKRAESPGIQINEFEIQDFSFLSSIEVDKKILTEKGIIDFSSTPYDCKITRKHILAILNIWNLPPREATPEKTRNEERNWIIIRQFTFKGRKINRNTLSQDQRDYTDKYEMELLKILPPRNKTVL
ncbi:MAG: hypothetical protein KBA61_08155 [Spirochaetes bacterium]|nr:hypothetical protein [Spirochaetota bacterium]